MSGDVSLSPGPNTSLNLSTGNGSWPGDADLEANTTANNTNNASAIQFKNVDLWGKPYLIFLIQTMIK